MAEPVTDEAVRVAQAADDQYATVPALDFQPLSEGRVRNLLEAAAPLIAAEIQRRNEAGHG